MENPNEFQMNRLSSVCFLPPNVKELFFFDYYQVGIKVERRLKEPELQNAFQTNVTQVIKNIVEELSYEKFLELTKRSRGVVSSNPIQTQ